MAKFKKGDRIQVHDTSDLRSDKVANEIGTVVKFAGKEGKEDVWLIKFDKRRVNMNLGDTDMDKLKESKLNESDLRQLIRAMVEQEMDKIDVADEEDKSDVTEKCKKDEELEIDLDETSSVTGMAGGESYQTPYAFAKRLKDRTREISQQLGYKLVNDPEDRDWKDIEDAQKESLVYRKKFAEMKVRSGLNEAQKYSEFEKFLITVDASSEGVLRKTLFKGQTYIDTPGMYQDEKDDYDDIHDFMISNMGSSDYDKLRDFYKKNKKIAQNFVRKYGRDKRLFEGRRGAYQNYRDDSDKTPRQKIGESLRNVRNQLQEIEKTIDLNLRLKQETGIDTQQYWKNTHRALAKINERMTRIINKVRRF
jgi:hypothetical protein